MGSGAEDDSCFEGPGPAAMSVGYFLTLGILISYIPQFYSIIRWRSSKGVSALTMWLSFICSFLTFLNAFMLDWDAIKCCRYLNPIQVFVQLLPLEQLFVGPFCLFFLYICIVYYLDITPAERVTHAQRTRDLFIAKALLVLEFVLVIALSLSVAGFIAFVGQDQHIYTGYAYALGLISTVLVAFVWLPQIYTTIVNKDIGALSIVMLLIQAPGNILVVCFQAILAGKNWSTWLPYVITAIEQLLLVALWVWFSLCRKGRKHSARVYDSESSNAPDFVEQLGGGGEASKLSPYLQLPNDAEGGSDSYDDLHARISIN